MSSLIPLSIALLAATTLAAPNAPGYGNTSASTTTSSSTPTAPHSELPVSTTILATATGKHTGLNSAARAKGKLWFGTAADIPGTAELQDKYYMREFKNSQDFGEATPANIMKFTYTEPEQGVFNFTAADEFLSLAEASHKKPQPYLEVSASWLGDQPSNTLDKRNSFCILKNHVQRLVKHFGNRCYSWDIVNEAFSDDPAGLYYPSIWFDTIGVEYVPMAFKTASDAAKEDKLDVKLYYNDYGIESSGAKSTAAQNLVKELQSRGIQIDGVGLESHLIAGETPAQADQEANMNAFMALGVEVAVTELDVRMPLPPTAADQLQQMKDYYGTIAACMAVDRCIGVTVWDFVDTYSWVPSTFTGQGYADLFFQPGGGNTPLVKKAAYDRCLEALAGAPGAV